MRAILTCLASLLLAGLLAGSATAGPSAFDAYTSVDPVAYLVSRVGGARVRALTLVRPGQEPHDFEPTARQMAAMAKAKVYFTIGLPFEEDLTRRLKAANPGLLIHDAAQGITRRRDEGHGHEHGHGHGHGHDDELDPHVWMSPRLARQLAANIAAGLSQADPAGRALYAANLARLNGELEAVTARIAGMLKPFQGREVLVYHPAFGYFLEEFGLKQLAVEQEGKEPGARGLARLIANARAQGIKTIYVQSQFPRSSAQAMARELGGRVVALDPLARDYLANLLRMAEALRRGLAKQGR